MLYVVDLAGLKTLILFQPEEVTHVYMSRQTALGLCDPVDDFRMDNWLTDKKTDKKTKLPQVSKPINRQQDMMKKE